MHELLMMACAPVELVKIGVALCWGNPSSPRKLQRKMAYAPASLAATYSDSGVERATVEMVFDFQETSAPPMRKTEPSLDLRSSMWHANAASHTPCT